MLGNTSETRTPIARLSLYPPTSGKANDAIKQSSNPASSHPMTAGEGQNSGFRGTPKQHSDRLVESLEDRENDELILLLIPAHEEVEVPDGLVNNNNPVERDHLSCRRQTETTRVDTEPAWLMIPRGRDAWSQLKQAR